MKINVEALTTPRERGVVGGFEVDAHQTQNRAQKALHLAQWQIEDESQPQSCLDRVIGELPLRTTQPRRRWFPRGNLVF